MENDQPVDVEFTDLPDPVREQHRPAPRDALLDACRRILRASEGTGIDVSPIELKKFSILLRLIEQDAK